jgi:hypothetical protein
LDFFAYFIAPYTTISKDFLDYRMTSNKKKAASTRVTSQRND